MSSSLHTPGMMINYNQIAGPMAGPTGVPAAMDILFEFDTAIIKVLTECRASGPDPVDVLGVSTLQF